MAGDLHLNEAMKRLLGVFVVIGSVILASGCGDDGGGSSEDADAGPLTPPGDDVPAAFESGFCLKAIYEDGGDGATALRAWFDSSLMIRCSFAMNEDFDHSCLPEASGPLEYSDSECTLAVMPFPATPPLFVSVDLPDRCIGRPRSAPYRVGAGTSPAEIYFRDPTGTCLPTTPQPGSYYQVTPEPIDNFVGAMVSDVPVSGEIGIRVLSAIDGSSEVLDMVDLGSGASCRPFEVDSQTVCLPGDFAYDFGRYAKSDCSTPIAYSIGADQCEAPQYVQVRTMGMVDGCPASIATLHEVGAANAPADTYDLAQACTPFTTGHFWNIGDASTSPALAVLEKGEATMGRLRREIYVAAVNKALPVQTGAWWDDELGQECHPLAIEAEKARCAPWGVSGFPDVSFWGDAACTSQELALDPQGGNLCSGQRTPSLRVEFTQEGTVAQAHDLGAVHPGDVYRKDAGGCNLHAPAQFELFYALGAANDLSSFPEIVTTQDP